MAPQFRISFAPSHTQEVAIGSKASVYYYLSNVRLGRFHEVLQLPHSNASTGIALEFDVLPGPLRSEKRELL